MGDDREDIRERTKTVAKIIGFSILYSIIQLILMPLCNEAQISVFNRIIVDNWGIGLFLLILFVAFYIINELPLFLFRANRFNKWMMLFWLSWILADWTDFLISIMNLIGV